MPRWDPPPIREPITEPSGNPSAAWVRWFAQVLEVEMNADKKTYDDPILQDSSKRLAELEALIYQFSHVRDGDLIKRVDDLTNLVHQLVGVRDADLLMRMDDVENQEYLQP